MDVTIIIAASCFAIGKGKKKKRRRYFPGLKDLDGYVEVSVTNPSSVFQLLNEQ